MKILALFLFLLLPVSFYSQKSGEQIGKEVKTFKRSLMSGRIYVVKYDKFTDKTGVFYSGSAITSTWTYMASKSSANINLGFEFESKDLKESVKDFALFFRSIGQGWTFLKNRNLYIIADEERMEFGEGERESDYGRGMFGKWQTSEILYFKIPRETVDKLAKAKNLELKVGNVVTVIKKEDKEAFQNILNLSKVD